MSHESVVATLEQQRQLRLQTDGKRLGNIIIPAMRSELNDAQRDRFEHVWQVSFDPPGFRPSNALPPLSQIIPELVDRLAAQTVVEPVSQKLEEDVPTRGGCRAFCVVEEKQSEVDGPVIKRLRFILWPALLNEWQTANYTPSVDLLHSSRYVDAVRHDAALQNDVSSGFYSFVIPGPARALFRFRDCTGRLFQMTRLPMGLRSAVELMHIATKVLVGHPDYVKPCSIVRNIQSHVFVDDFRCAGAPAALEEARAVIDARAKSLGIILKSTTEIKTRYVFLGLVFDHDKKTISISSKTDRKLPDDISPTTTAIELQRLVARLIWCSGGLRIPLACFYFPMKWATRLCNRINAGEIAPSDVVSLPPSVVDSLRQWLHVARMPYRNAHRPGNQHMILFTDASIKGWGAYLILPDGRLYITGGSWRFSATSGDIAALEARAVRYAVDTFARLIARYSEIELRIDNTSVASAIPRGVARSFDLNRELAPVFTTLRALHVTATASYVESSRNLADPVSRQLPALPISREEVERLMNERRGAGGVWSEL